MKRTFFVYGFIVFSFFGCMFFSPKMAGVVEISDFRKTGIPRVDLSIHKDKDVEVKRTIEFVGEAYEIFFYRMENDSLKYFSAIYGSEELFDKARYRWKNDSTVLIRLVSPVSNKKVKIKVWGIGPVTGMEM